MDNTSNNKKISDRDLFYYRQRFKNRVHSKILEFFEKEAKKKGISRKDIAEILDKDPAQITRWLNSANNLTLETISDLLLALAAEVDNFEIRSLEEKPIRNYQHPLISRILAATVKPSSSENRASGQLKPIPPAASEPHVINIIMRKEPEHA